MDVFAASVSIAPDPGETRGGFAEAGHDAYSSI
jgi:hypothetical protein